jgi:hypothetical protein
VAKPRREKLDRVDADLIEQVVQSRGWQLIRQRVEHEIERERTALEQPGPETETAWRRGKLAGLRDALQIPKLLMAEGERGRTDE